MQGLVLKFGAYSVVSGREKRAGGKVDVALE